MSPSSPLYDSIQYVKGVGPSLAKLFTKLGIKTILDGFYHFPRQYEDRRQLPLIAQLELNATQIFLAQITTVSHDTTKSNKQILKVGLKDRSGSIVGYWFNQPFLARTFKSGMTILVSGKIIHNQYTQQRQVLVSSYEIIKTKDDFQMSVGCVVPVYPLVAGLSNHKLRQTVADIFSKYHHKIEDHLPKELQTKMGLMPLPDALYQLHFPKNRNHYQLARKRLVFDEFFYMQLPMLFRNQQVKEHTNGPKLQVAGELINQHLTSKPYTLTAAQLDVIGHLKQDVDGNAIMNRLVQGDVGSGKTDIAMMAMLFAIESGYKAAMMAPTEILATQHYLKLTTLFEPLGIPVVLLKGKQLAKERKASLEMLSQPQPTIVVGTHALIEDDIMIDNLALIVIDEQHRFGVHQRTRLRKKGRSPHCLYLTATPIPRSLMLTCYGDLDKSIISELPPGRIPCKTVFSTERKLESVYQFCEKQLAKLHQIYIVLPLIEESEKLDLKSATQEFEKVQNRFSNHKVGLLHGRLTNEQKSEVMTQFRANEIQILVATTVIEVGVDVPNATTMIIHNAQRFGLSQLHQLRGRVGRGADQSYCFLIGEAKTPESKRRLQAMVNSNDGFEIARIDLEIRGPGDMLGTRQSGLPMLNLADLVRDEPVLLMARMIAKCVIKSDPTLTHPHHKLIRQRLASDYKEFLSDKLN